MGLDDHTFPIEYDFSPSADAEERLAQAYELIFELILASHQIPEEDAVGALPNGSDAGDVIHAPTVKNSSSLGAIHAR